MTVVDVKLINPDETENYYISDIDNHFKFWGEMEIDSNAKLLLINIEVENVGKTATDENTLLRERTDYIMGGILYENPDFISVYYEGAKMKDVLLTVPGYNSFSCYCSQYPGTIKEGVIGFEVPKNIDLNKAVLKMHGLEWILG